MEQRTTKNRDGGKEKVMSFWEHLEELRGTVIRIIIAILALAIIAFLNRHLIFDTIILAPSTSHFITYRLLCELGTYLHAPSLCVTGLNLKIINISMSGQFLTHIYVSAVTGAILSFPYILWEIWRFVQPALLPKEKKYSRGGLFFSTFLFLVGVVFSYFLIVPIMVNFLGTYSVSSDVANQITLKSYIGTMVSMIFAVGIVFELPILVYFMTRIGVITPDFLKKNRKYMIVVLLAVSAIITPPDVFSQMLVFIPLEILFEVSILVSKRVYKKVLRRARE